MKTKDSIEQVVRESIAEVVGERELSVNANLLDTETGIVPVNFLYIFDLLEKKLCLPVCEIFVDHGYDVMTITGLTDALFKLDSDCIQLANETE